MPKKTAAVKDTPIDTPLSAGDVIWALWGGKYWPARVAQEEEVLQEERALKRNRDYLIRFFGDGSYDWVKANACFTWNANDESKLKTNKSAKTALKDAEEWSHTDPKIRVFPRPQPKKASPAESKSASEPKKSKPNAKRKRDEAGIDANLSDKPAKKPKSANSTSEPLSSKGKTAKATGAATQQQPQQKADKAAPKRRKLDLVPEKNPKPTPEYKRTNGKLISELSPEERAAIEKRRVKRRAIMRELALWPPKGTIFPLE